MGGWCEWGAWPTGPRPPIVTPLEAGGGGGEDMQSDTYRSII